MRCSWQWLWLSNRFHLLGNGVLDTIAVAVSHTARGTGSDHAATIVSNIARSRMLQLGCAFCSSVVGCFRSCLRTTAWTLPTFLCLLAVCRSCDGVRFATLSPATRKLVVVLSCSGGSGLTAATRCDVLQGVAVSVSGWYNMLYEPDAFHGVFRIDLYEMTGVGNASAKYSVPYRAVPCTMEYTIARLRTFASISRLSVTRQRASSVPSKAV